MNLGADLKDARRRFPLAITAGMFTVVALYLMLNFAYQRVLGISGIAGSSLVAAANKQAKAASTDSLAPTHGRLH
jgi:APA family basic amino acid/polyamine antiporter